MLYAVAQALSHSPLLPSGAGHCWWPGVARGFGEPLQVRCGILPDLMGSKPFQQPPSGHKRYICGI